MDKFANIFLNTKLYKQLIEQIKSNNFSQTHIVLSQDEYSNILFSRLVANAIICSNSSYCQCCEDCIKLKSNTHPDLKEFSKDKGFVVANATEILDDVYKLAYNNKKVYIINNIDLATLPAQNKLLKILEEPPKNVFFILNSTNQSSVLPTILSRASKILLTPFDFDFLQSAFSQNNLTLDVNSYVYGEGFIGKILQFDNDKKFQAIFNKTFEILQNVQKSSDIILYSEYIKKEDMPVFLKSLQIFLSDILYIKTNNENLVKSAFKQQLKDLSNQFSINAISSINKKITQANAHLSANVNYSIVKDMLLLGILEAKYIYKDN